MPLKIVVGLRRVNGIVEMDCRHITCAFFIWDFIWYFKGSYHIPYVLWKMSGIMLEGRSLSHIISRLCCVSLCWLICLWSNVALSMTFFIFKLLFAHIFFSAIQGFGYGMNSWQIILHCHCSHVSVVTPDLWAYLRKSC